MNTLQHTIIYLASIIEEGKFDETLFKENIPYILLPDALRLYIGREATHFEETSWMTYPDDIRKISKKEETNQLLKFQNKLRLKKREKKINTQ